MNARLYGVEGYLISLLKRSQTLSYYASSRGWGFVMAWAHRVAGLLLVVYVLFHIVTLTGLQEPARFSAKMAFLDNVFFAFLEWTLAVPVIFHALNGIRLILYELFGVRDEKRMLRWVFALSALYVCTLGLFMALGNQHISAGVFWLTTALAALLVTGGVCDRVWQTQNSLGWKLQRVSAAFLFPMVCGHMFFMHLNAKAGHDVNTILERMSGMGIRVIDFVFVVVIFFHAGFGLNTIIGDTVENNRLRTGIKMASCFVVLVFAYVGLRLVANI
ncbi:MAG: hypothetical protein JRI36_01955 [Deltaproteobacteria bacterium]|nr:hypothetical protein [Deltaproteobacteria bacterium]